MRFTILLLACSWLLKYLLLFWQPLPVYMNLLCILYFIYYCCESTDSALKSGLSEMFSPWYLLRCCIYACVITLLFHQLHPPRQAFTQLKAWNNEALLCTVPVMLFACSCYPQTKFSAAAWPMVLLMLVLIIVQHGSIVILMRHVSDHVKMYVDLFTNHAMFIHKLDFNVSKVSKVTY